jgi:hypothetical protein
MKWGEGASMCALVSLNNAEVKEQLSFSAAFVNMQRVRE